MSGDRLNKHNWGSSNHSNDELVIRKDPPYMKGLFYFST